MAELVQYRDRATDNSRWALFSHRPDDIFVCTPAKCGTTWTQTIVASLLFPDGDCPGQVLVVSPWLDGRMFGAKSTLKQLEEQEHRRFIKTHTPADGVPFWDDARYITVFRDGRDAFMSLLNHETSMRPEAIARINEQALADGGNGIDVGADPHARFATWLGQRDNAVRHLASWWPLREKPNVLFVHYNDLKADLDGEMRRIAEFLGIEVDPGLWAGVVERCTFESMKAHADEIAQFDMIFEGGSDAFLFKGTNGRWHDFLTEDELERYDALVAETLDAQAGTWLEQGGITLDFRP